MHAEEHTQPHSVNTHWTHSALAELVATHTRNLFSFGVCVPVPTETTGSVSGLSITSELNDELNDLIQRFHNQLHDSQVPATYNTGSY